MRDAVLIDSHGATDVGKERRANEDQFLLAGLHKGMMVQQTSLAMDDQTPLTGGMQGKLLVVADGMGGQAAGDHASQLAMQTLMDYVLNTMPWFFRLEEHHEEDLLDELTAGLERCHAQVKARGAQRPELRGMGTTLTMAYVLWPRMYVVHIGDSRCYVLRGGRLHQITTDHSMAQALVDKGTLQPEEAQESEWAHVLHKAIVDDDDTSLDPDIYKAELAYGDRVLLCTDGLTKHLDDEQIAAVVQQTDGVRDAVSRLVARANEEGGSDNVTVVLSAFERS